MVSGPENLRFVWLVRRAQDQSGKWTGILDFRTSAPGSVWGKETIRFNFCKRITVSTYRKDSNSNRKTSERLITLYKWWLGQNKKYKWKNVARPERHNF